jgi:hypothetical protein
VELESLAPLKMLSPGDSVIHVETWDVFDGMDSIPEEVKQALTAS